MPKRPEIKKVMVIGSGPIIIGQAAEFDYAGSQACRALKEEGVEVVLVNSNPATIMTDTHMAERIYIEPLTVESITKILREEQPDGILPTLGGQIGLNVALDLARTGIFEELNIELLGTSLDTIEKAENRDAFKQLMEEIGEPVLQSQTVETLQEAKNIAKKIGYPVIIRPAFTMGGTGGGVADDEHELEEIALRGFKHSRIGQILIERSVKGWKEIEYEVMRDHNDNCIAVCNMENFDPVGIHTGDSIVVAPSQTLSDKEYHMLRTSALRIIRALGVEGGCNVQYALDPHSMQYFLIEVNPRVSRSSALASKATGYPIAKVSAKIALGYTLDEIDNEITNKTKACFEPTLDYVVVKIPRWPFDKFNDADRLLGTQMKATGEVMAIGRTLELALLKAIRSLEVGLYGLRLPVMSTMNDTHLLMRLVHPDDQRIFAVAEALRRDYSIERLNRLTGIDPFFLRRIQCIIDGEQRLQQYGLSSGLLQELKMIGFSDLEIAALCGESELEVKERRQALGIAPVYKMVDTCAGEFEAATPYFYSTYEPYNEAIATEKEKVLVLGSGPIRIGQGIEFDYCCVHSAWALKEAGYESLIINNNPETVSTDFDTSDRLYFEPLTKEDVMHVINLEKPMGVIVQFGGQTAINLAKSLHEEGVQILGSSVESIDMAEDRDRFLSLLQDLAIPSPAGGIATSVEQAVEIAQNIHYPVLVRPSYVLGGRAMEVVYTDKELQNYMQNALEAVPNQTILIDKYILGKEVEVDAISDGETVVIPGIMEHIERAGVHSGDSITVYPAQSLSEEILEKVKAYTIQLAQALNVKGLMNVQYVVSGEMVYVIEVNPRSSRTVPYLSKVTGVPMVKLATEIMLGKNLKDLGYETGIVKTQDIVAVKVPVFSFSKLTKVDTHLGPEMKSTGEVLGLDQDFYTALYKGFVGAGVQIPKNGTILATIADKDKQEVIPHIKAFADLGFKIMATGGTAQALQQAGVSVERVNKLSEGWPHVIDFIRNNKIQLVINTLTRGKISTRDGFQIRRTASEMGIPCLTSLDTTKAVWHVLDRIKDSQHVTVRALQDYIVDKM